MAGRVAMIALAAAAGSAGCSSHGQSASRTVRVAAAADLDRAFGELGAAFAAKTGITPRFDFGSSGLLAKQIEAGAPYFLFAAANRSYVDQVVAAGACDASTIAHYARGELVVWTPAGTPPPSTFADLADPRFRKIAIANSDHAPYGVAAKQALVAAGIWDKVGDRLVIGENVAATLQYARSGNADVAIVARSLVTGPDHGVDGGATLTVDEGLHAPLDQALVVCGHGDEADAARQLAAFVMSADGRAVLAKYGFTNGGATGDAKGSAR